MVSEAGIIEQVTDEILEMEPEAYGGAKVQVASDDPEYPYAGNLRLSNFIRFHHPDGTHSDIAAPTYNPKRPTPYRRRFLQHWLAKRGPNGGRWYFLRRQAPAPELPIRCFVRPGGRQCTKRLSSLPDLFMHVQAKHGEEAKLYGNFMKAIERKMQAEVDPETLKALGLGEEKEAVEAFYCRNEGCPRFFDNEPSRNSHEYKCPQKRSG